MQVASRTAARVTFTDLANQIDRWSQYSVYFFGGGLFFFFFFFLVVFFLKGGRIESVRSDVALQSYKLY